MTSRKEIVIGIETRLRATLPATWRVAAIGSLNFAGALSVAPPGNKRPFVLQIDVPPAPSPGLIESRLMRSRRLLKPGEQLIIAANYLSPESRRVLIAAEVSFFDLTGNVRIRTEHPPMFVQDRGSDRCPERAPRAARSLRGGKSLAIVRALCDHLPPISASRLAQVARTTPGNVSKLLTKLEHEGLIERGPRGPVTHVAWRSLIEARAAEVDLLDACEWRQYVPTAGGPQLMDALAKQAASLQLAITGGYAVRDITAAGGSRFFCYTPDAERLATGLPLRHTHTGHIVLLEPPDPAVFDRTRTTRSVPPDLMSQAAIGVPNVAVSQAAIDCLSGPDRMPEVGLATLDWMENNEAEWREALPTEDG